MFLDLKWLKLHSSGKHSLELSFYNVVVLIAVAKWFKYCCYFLTIRLHFFSVMWPPCHARSWLPVLFFYRYFAIPSTHCSVKYLHNDHGYLHIFVICKLSSPCFWIHLLTHSLCDTGWWREKVTAVYQPLRWKPFTVLSLDFWDLALPFEARFH